jgi:hypothetical protein
MRKPMGYRPINPLITNVFLDSCAFDPKYHPEDFSSRVIYKLYESGKLILHITHSNQKELEHPNTPSWVKKLAGTLIFSYNVPLVDEELAPKKAILKILAGNGSPERMREDAEHVFNASKYGSYFVTTDVRILKRQEELRRLCSIHVLKPSEMIEIIKSYEAI